MGINGTNGESYSYVDTLQRLVERIFIIEDVTTGGAKQDYLVRFHGKLIDRDSEAAYDRIWRETAPFNVTPLFRVEDDRQTIYIKEGRMSGRTGKSWVNFLMFGLTILSVAFVGGASSLTSDLSPNWLTAAGQLIFGGLPFAAALLGILLTHELGHYIAGRIHGLPVTLPYFIPVPIPPFGTMGAVINMSSPPKNKRHLLDIGLAGPLAGLIVALPILAYGLSLSPVENVPTSVPAGMAMTLEGNSLLYLGMKFLIHGQLLPAPTSYGGMPQWLYWLQFMFTSQPYPLGGKDVMLHPIALAAWGGLLVTALNLIPAGQFDGGHVMYVLFGKRGLNRMRPFLLIAAGLLGFFWAGWWLWALLIYFIGRAVDDPLDQITELNPARRALAWLSIVIFILVFTPVPFSVFGG